MENINTKKSILYTAINLRADIFYILFNIFAHLIIFIKKKWEDYKFNLFYKNKDKETDFSKESNYQNNFNVNDIYKEPIKEGIVNNGTPNQFDKQVDNKNVNNKINNNINNNKDLGVPPAIFPSFSSDIKLK